MTQSLHLSPSPFYRILFVLLDGLRWRGNRSFLEKFVRGEVHNMTLPDLLNTLSSLKFSPKHKFTQLRNLRDEDLPCIVLKSSRIYVLTKVLERSFEAIDVLVWRKMELKKDGFRHEIICFKRIEKEELTLQDSQQDWFAKVAARFKIFAFYIFSLSFVITVLNIMAPLLVVVVFRQIEAAKSLDHLIKLLYGLAIYVCVLTVTRLARSQLLNYLAARLGFIIGSQVMRRILYLPSSYTEAASVASQMARLRDFDSVQQFVPSLGTDALLDIPFTLLMIITVFFIAGYLGLVPIGALIIFTVFGLLMRKKIDFASADASRFSKDRYDFFMDTLNNLEQVQAQYLLPFWQERFLKIARKASISITRSAQTHNIISSFSYFIVTAAGLITIILGVNAVQAGTIDSATLMATMLLTWKILAPMRNGFSFIMQIDRLKKTVSQIDRLMALPLEEISEDAYEIDKQIKGSIQFQQVSLKYTNDAHPALLGVNFKIEAKETLVIFDHGGSGQTSVLKLILGLYFPQAGRVLIDNKNTRQINPTFLRENIAYLSQEPTIFTGTILQTIKMYAPMANPEDIEQTFQRFGLWDHINALPDGFHTMLDRHGKAHLGYYFLRRLHFALLVLKKCKLWIFDNPGPLEDESNREYFLKLIQSLRSEATVVIATKNTDYFDHCDKVLWLNSGRVQFFGTPQEVMNNLKQVANR